MSPSAYKIFILEAFKGQYFGENYQNNEEHSDDSKVTAVIPTGLEVKSDFRNQTAKRRIAARDQSLSAVQAERNISINQIEIYREAERKTKESKPI